MSAPRRTLREQAKRQISAARTLTRTLNTLGLGGSASALDRDELARQLQRLEVETEALVHATYGDFTDGGPGCSAT